MFLNSLGRGLLIPLALCAAVRVPQARQASAFLPARQVARAADLNRDGQVSVEEWQDLLTLLDPDGDGQVATRDLILRATLPMIDRSEDGQLTLEDLFQLFGELDNNKDDALNQTELARRLFGTGTRNAPPTKGGSSLPMGVLIFRPADLNHDGEVDPEEWGGFVDAIELTRDEAIEESQVRSWIENELARPEDANEFNATWMLHWMLRELDQTGDDQTSVEFMQQLYDSLDDGDGALATNELSRSGRGARQSAAERNRDKPALMPWQRNLEDALALVESSGKPLLICVNMDDEFASESFAWSRYRDPAFVALASGFIPLLVSPNRHNPRDYDDRGRRLTDRRFGRLINREHIGIESQLYERYFRGQRPAPRHLGVSPGGEVLFDIFLENDLSLVDKALKEHGRPSSGASVVPATLPESELLESPDALQREELERRFVAGDLGQRARLAALALSPIRKTQHPELLRLALLDAQPQVRLQGAWCLVQNPERADLGFFAKALAESRGNARLHAALLASLRRRSETLGSSPEGHGARDLHQAWTALEMTLPGLDLERWRGALAWSPLKLIERSRTREETIEELSRASKRAFRFPQDPESQLAFASASMARALLALEEARDAEWMLNDVLLAGERAYALDPRDGRGLAYRAWAQELRGEPELAYEEAAQAAPKLIGWAASALCARTLRLCLDSRVAAIDQALQGGAAWPARWLAEAAAAHGVLLLHPSAEARTILAYVDLCNRLRLVGPQVEALRAGLERFPAEEQLHLALVAQFSLNLEGWSVGSAAELSEAYDGLVLQGLAAHERAWFVGLAKWRAAEWEVENRDPRAARQSYQEAALAFQEALRGDSSRRQEAASHFCLAMAGLARLQSADQEWSLAQESLRAGILAEPEAVWKRDGLGNSPRECAQELYRSLVGASREDEARALRGFLSKNGLEIED